MASKTPSEKSGDKKIIFKCNQCPAIISDKLQYFYLEKEFFDTELMARDEDNSVVIQAHKIVLCSWSGYFLKVFRSAQPNLRANLVELKEIAAPTLKLVVDFMYSGIIELSLETVEEILRTASFLQIQTLINGCSELIEKNINSNNSLKTFQMAKELSLPKLKSKALEYIYINFEDISKTNEILALSEDELMDLLFISNPYGDMEENAFFCMVAWINHNKTNREHLLFRLLKMVRYQALTPKFIVENRKSVCKTIESYELICSWLQWHLSPETRPNYERPFRYKQRKPETLAITRFTNNNKIKIETFNRQLNSWTTKTESSLSAKRYDCSITLTSDGQPIVFGGNDGRRWTNKVEYLDRQSLSWLNLPPVTNGHYKKSQLIKLKGSFCVLGGENVQLLYMYNFSEKTWSNLNLPSRTSQTKQMTAHNEMLYVLDFQNGQLQSYDVSSNKWTSCMVPANNIRNFGFVAVKGFLYVIGGNSQGVFMSDKVKRYDLSNNSWAELASLPHPSLEIRAAVFDNKIVIVGNNSCEVQEYNLSTGTWSTMRILDEGDLQNIVDISTISV